MNQRPWICGEEKEEISGRRNIRSKEQKMR
jgi:hypothetical protein